MPDEMYLNPHGWRRPTWLLLLVAASVAFTFTFACAAPFAAFAAASTCTLPRRDAYSVAGAVWLANQGVGFAFLHYPWTMNCLAWGAALGTTSLLSTLAARLTMRRLAQVWVPARNPVTFLAAFAAYEAAVIVFSLRRRQCMACSRSVLVHILRRGVLNFNLRRQDLGRLGRCGWLRDRVNARGCAALAQ